MNWRQAFILAKSRFARERRALPERIWGNSWTMRGIEISPRRMQGKRCPEQPVSTVKFLSI
jgi:hypothetical protein